jgi:tetrahydromethanopterin S-methyltransferase subunit G
MTDAVEQWDMRITKSNARLAEDVSPELLAEQFPDVEGDAISDLCNDAMMVCVNAGDTLIGMGHFREAYGTDENDDVQEDTPEDDVDESPPGPEIYDEDNEDVHRDLDPGAPVRTMGADGADTGSTQDTESVPSEMGRDELEAEVADLRDRVDEMESTVRESNAIVEAVRRQMKQHTKLLVGGESIQDVTDPDEEPSYHEQLGNLDDRVDNVEAEVESLDGVVADGSGGKVSKVHDIVQLASNRRSDEALVAMEVNDIVDATGVSRRYANDLIDGPNCLPGEYEWMHQRKSLKQYGDLELDTDAQNKALVIDFAGVQGKACPVNKFTTGGS